jgi:hypothetical protein
MYTVIRFRAPETKCHELRHVGELLNRTFSYTLYTGLDKGDSSTFSCSICSADSWSEHRNAINDFVQTGRQTISVAVDAGLKVFFDVAIYQNDYKGDLFLELSFDLATMQKLILAGVELIVTAYAHPDQ